MLGSGFDEQEGQLEFLVDNLDGSNLLETNTDFEHFLLLDPDSQSC